MATEIPQNRAPFSLNEVIDAVGGELALPGRTSSVGVATDTRCALEARLFVALAGERFDAHHFLDRAVEGGAHLLIVQPCAAVSELIARSEGRASSERPSVVVVDDTLVALGDLAAFHRRRSRVRLLTIAGSAGKTTTRCVTSALMNAAAKGLVHSTRGNLNNRIGVPMTLLGIEAHHRFAVIEVGTNQPGEIALLARMCAADVAVLTLIDLEHTEGLADLDGVEREEAAVFSQLGERGAAVGYGEDPRVRRSVESAPARRRLTYGESEGHQVRIVDRLLVSPSRARLTLSREDASRLVFETSLIGRAGALAAAAGVAGAEALLGRALSAEEAQSALSEVGEAGRHQVLRLPEGRLVLDDSYNSNPASVPLSVAVGLELCALTGGRLWLVLGEMLELGRLSQHSHQAMGDLAGRSGAVGLFFVQGDASVAAESARQHLDAVVFCEHATEVAPLLAPLLQAGDVTVVKASRGVRAERVVEGLTAWFSEQASLVEPPRRGKE